MNLHIGGMADFLAADLWLRMGMAVVCGSIVGFDRQMRGKPAGIRTCSLITLGTCVFALLGETYTDGDRLRILGQTITGIGFLGAGVIMSREGLVTGVTSAAVIWVLAGVGTAIGLGFLGAALAVTSMVLLVLLGVEWLEVSFQKLRRGGHGRHTRQTLCPEDHDDRRE
ncbi:MAG: MgtC/SapB family protein [Thermodesulfobacteriota bacterium]